MKRFTILLLSVVASVATCFGQYNFTTVNYPGAANTRLVGLNDHGQIVGNYTLADNIRHAFMLSKGQFIALDPNGILGSHMSAANQINNRGYISGWYVDEAGRHGYVLRDGVVNTIDYPGASFTQVNGVTDTEAVIGHFIGTDGHFHGFILQDGSFQQIDFPGANDTFPFYMNARGQIAGEWTQSTGGFHGFVRSKDGQWESFNAPGSSNNTFAIGINDHGIVMGNFFLPSGLPVAFLVRSSQLQSPEAYSVIAIPWENSFPETMNSSGTFVGLYSDATGIHGFVATPAAH